MTNHLPKSRRVRRIVAALVLAGVGLTTVAACGYPNGEQIQVCGSLPCDDGTGGGGSW